MKALTSVVLASAAVLAALAATTTYACDEECRRKAAEEKHKVEFPGYLTWDYCDDIRMDFMTSSMRSLENYQTNHFDTRYKGGMRNIAKYIKQRQEWLKECDQYLVWTGKDRIFEDDETTEELFTAMERVRKELTDLANGVVYTTNIGEDPGEVMNDRFDHFFKLVEDHKTLMHLKGKYVFR